MSKFSVDFTKLEDKLLKKSYRLVDVKDQLETVAFDVVRFKDSDKGASLWQVQSAEDGDYIVTLYEDEPEGKKTASGNDWEIVVSSGTNLTQKTASEIVKEGFIKKLPNGKWRVVSEKGKNLGTYDSKEEAKKRLRQVEYFKHNAAMLASFVKSSATIKNLPNGKFEVVSDGGKPMGTYDTKTEAEDRLRAGEYFKDHPKQASASKMLHFYYKGEPIVKIASNKIGIPEAELSSVENYLPKKLASNKKLVAALLSELPETAKKQVLNKYPELL